PNDQVVEPGVPDDEDVRRGRRESLHDRRRGAALRSAAVPLDADSELGRVQAPGRGFQITREGRQGWEEFERTEIWRKNPTLPLTVYFDPVAYGLVATGKSKLHVVKVRGAA